MAPERRSIQAENKVTTTTCRDDLDTSHCILSLVSSFPKDVYLAPLKPEHAKQINSIWHHSFPNSQSYVENLIRMNGGVGAFDRKTNKLCSWVMTNDYNAHGVLQTVDECKRKNYARELVKDLSKKKAEMGMDSVTNIGRSNMASQNLFTSVGFKKLANIRWVQFQRSRENKL